MSRRLAITIAIGSLTSIVLLYFNSIHSTIVKILTIGSIFSLIFALLYLVWQGKIWRLVIIFIPIILLLLFLLPSRDRSSDRLRNNYLNNLLSLEGTKYVWGGENSTGIDCSGLPRKALRDALFFRGITGLDGKYLRSWFEQWWYDASADALGKQYRNYTISLPISTGKIRHLDYSKLEVGDMAVTTNGVHLLVYLGDDSWIQADPHAGKTIIVNGRDDRNAWLDLPVNIYRWKILAK